MSCYQPVDYDSLSNPFFNLTVYAQDLDPTHVDTAYVEIRVTDYNDNRPLFVPNSKKVGRTTTVLSSCAFIYSFYI